MQLDGFMDTLQDLMFPGNQPGEDTLFDPLHLFGGDGVLQSMLPGAQLPQGGTNTQYPTYPQAAPSSGVSPWLLVGGVVAVGAIAFVLGRRR